MIPRFVIADSTPLSVLSLLGRNGLDLLLATGAELVITDAVRDELLEDPGPGTAAYLRVLADEYNNKLAADAWVAVAAVADTQLDPGIDGDPLVFRR